MQIWNRGDGYQNRLQSFSIYAGGGPPPAAGTLLSSAYQYNPACYSFSGGYGPTTTGTYPCATTARYVTFQSLTPASSALGSAGTNFVGLCNVAVYGALGPPSAPADYAPMTLPVVAAGGPCVCQVPRWRSATW